MRLVVPADGSPVGPAGERVQHRVMKGSDGGYAAVFHGGPESRTRCVMKISLIKKSAANESVRLTVAGRNGHVGPSVNNFARIVTADLASKVGNACARILRLVLVDLFATECTRYLRINIASTRYVRHVQHGPRGLRGHPARLVAGAVTCYAAARVSMSTTKPSISPTSVPATKSNSGNASDRMVCVIRLPGGLSGPGGVSAMPTNV